MPKRRRARIVAFQIMYSTDFNPLDLEEAARRYAILEPQRKGRLPDFSLELVQAVRNHIPEIDRRIEAIVKNFRPERILTTDRCLLRLGCAELLYFPDIPPRVTLDEYIDLAREFSDEASPDFINGVLDAVLKQIGKKDPPPPPLAPSSSSVPPESSDSSRSSVPPMSSDPSRSSDSSRSSDPSHFSASPRPSPPFPPEEDTSF